MADMTPTLAPFPHRDTLPVNDHPGGVLSFLYATLPGRILLKILTRPALSRLAGRFMDSRCSRPLIAPFLRNNHIDLADYLPEDYPSFNACFTRRIRPERRPIDRNPAHLIAPCDCKLSAYPIDEDSRFWIKGAPYTVAELLENEELAAGYWGGICLICRLTVDDYHRYCYIDDGHKERNRFIPGVLHTVQPVALAHENIYKRNCREYTLLHTAHFGDVVQVEVGALLVGRICNHHGEADCFRGIEKGYFAYGGSTIVLLLKAGAAAIDPAVIENTQKGLETIVRMGEAIGVAINHP